MAKRKKGVQRPCLPDSLPENSFALPDSGESRHERFDFRFQRWRLGLHHRVNLVLETRELLDLHALQFSQVEAEAFAGMTSTCGGTPRHPTPTALAPSISAAGARQ